MYRLFHSNPFYLKIPLVLYNSSSYHKRTLSSCFKASVQHKSYSTLPQQKMIFVSPRPKNKVKLKVKPYEELLKILEIRQQELRNKDEVSSKFEETNSSCVETVSSTLKHVTENKNLNVHNNELCVDENNSVIRTSVVSGKKTQGKSCDKESSKEKKMKKLKTSKKKSQEVNKEEFETVTLSNECKRVTKNENSCSVKTSVNSKKGTKTKSSDKEQSKEKKRKKLNSSEEKSLQEVNKGLAKTILSSKSKPATRKKKSDLYNESLDKFVSETIQFFKSEALKNETKVKKWDAESSTEKELKICEKKSLQEVNNEEFGKVMANELKPVTENENWNVYSKNLQVNAVKTYENPNEETNATKWDDESTEEISKSSEKEFSQEIDKKDWAKVALSVFKSEYKNLKECNKNLCFGEGIYTIKTYVDPEKEKETKTKSSDCEATKEKKKKKKKKTKSPQEVNKEEFEETAKNMHAAQSLKSFIEVSINANQVEKAQRVFDFYRTKHKLKNTVETFANIDVYNAIISGWAQKGRLDKVKRLFSLFSDDGLAPNLQSYASYLECISRNKLVDVSDVQNIVREMQSKGYSTKDLLLNCIFVGDQREQILKVLGFIESNHSFPQYVPEEAYSCKLLQKLNDKSYQRGEDHFNFCFQMEDIPEIATAQMEAESHFNIKIKSVDSCDNNSDTLLRARKYLKELEEMWREKLKEKLKIRMDNEKAGLRSSGICLYPYLAVVDTETIIDLLLQEVRMLAETGEFFSPNVRYLYYQLGLKVMNHYFIALNKKNKVFDKVLSIQQEYLSYLLNPDLFAKYSPREYWEFLKNKYSDGPTIDVAVDKWPQSIITHIGKYLYTILMYNISFNANIVRNKEPCTHMATAFCVIYEGLDVKLSRQIRTHPLLCKLYRNAKLEYLEFDVSLVPMLCPPKPWVKHNAGGLLMTATPFIRFPEHAEHQVAFYSEVPSKQLNPCFDSLNSLSLCPWKINKPMLDFVIDVFQKGGSEELDIPLNPSSFAKASKILPSMPKEEQTSTYWHNVQLQKEKTEMTGLWYDCLYKLSIANHFRDKIFWFPHNLDFRGRVYPTPPHFNHLGSDVVRSILLFADGKPLGKNGLNWLKIHLINLTGFKKRDPHVERLKYANEMLPEILDLADHPFDGNQWWKTSDKPWQTLACCMELAKAVRHPNPEEYISHFPIHQDGSCNGLQHYAALGRDELGAIEVNLHPSESPHDVYSGVAALVEKERQIDAENDVEIAQQLKGFIGRKVVKQPVMTFVYGVTGYGAKLQILKQLKDIPEFPEKYHNEGSTYLMKKIFRGIQEMFTATKEIQDWFTLCAEHITRSSGDTLEWVTPLGLPVIQPYHKKTSVRSSKYCFTQGTDSSYISSFEPYKFPNVRKQKNAFAPNFIHSLDSSHMMLTSLFCQRKGITFVSVHDCFWTHSCTVEIMNKICREQFLSLHNEPILENLSAFFLEKYIKVAEENIRIKKSSEKSEKKKLKELISEVPDKGTFDLNKVLSSEYFFS